MNPRDWLSAEIGTAISTLHGYGIAGLAATAGLHFLVSASGVVPASLVGMAAGAAYGPVTGFIVAACGLMAGALAAFGLSRSALRPFLSRRLRKHRAWSVFEHALSRDGWRMVCLVRLSPIMPFAIASYGFGLLPVKISDYVIGSLASLPALALYVVAGHLAHIGLSADGSGQISITVLRAIGVVATLLAGVRIGRLAIKALGSPT
jgi:uncharacterized membrane protein YdjX (TVP38/TMEM64 family)